MDKGVGLCNGSMIILRSFHAFTVAFHQVYSKENRKQKCISDQPMFGKKYKTKRVTQIRSNLIVINKYSLHPISAFQIQNIHLLPLIYICSTLHNYCLGSSLRLMNFHFLMHQEWQETSEGQMGTIYSIITVGKGNVLSKIKLVYLEIFETFIH